MAAIPYLPNIPAATDKLSVSQGNIQTNFQGIQTLVDVNHADFANATYPGCHTMVTFVDQTGSLPAQPTAPALNVYNAQDAASINQLYLQGGIGSQWPTAFPFTQSNQATGGWTYLPSGIKMAWGRVASIGTGFVNISLNTSLFGTNFPGFTTAFSSQVTLGSIGTIPNPPVSIVISSLSSSTLQVLTNLTSGTTPAYIFVIGV